MSMHKHTTNLFERLLSQSSRIPQEQKEVLGLVSILELLPHPNRIALAGKMLATIEEFSTDVFANQKWTYVSYDDEVRAVAQDSRTRELDVFVRLQSSGSSEPRGIVIEAKTRQLAFDKDQLNDLRIICDRERWYLVGLSDSKDDRKTLKAYGGGHLTWQKMLDLISEQVDGLSSSEPNLSVIGRTFITSFREYRALGKTTSRLMNRELIERQMRRFISESRLDRSKRHLFKHNAFDDAVTRLILSVQYKIDEIIASSERRDVWQVRSPSNTTGEQRNPNRNSIYQLGFSVHPLDETNVPPIEVYFNLFVGKAKLDQDVDPKIVIRVGPTTREWAYKPIMQFLGKEVKWEYKDKVKRHVAFLHGRKGYIDWSRLDEMIDDTVQILTELLDVPK